MNLSDLWRGEFGDRYHQRTAERPNIDARTNLLRTATSGLSMGSVLELGAGLGWNLEALKGLYPNCRCSALEVNEQACQTLDRLGFDVEAETVETWLPSWGYELVLTMGFLIHVHPDEIRSVYEKMASAAASHIFMGEYFRPQREEIAYREPGAMWGADFCREFLESQHDWKLKKYGFVYHTDGLDNLTWWLLERV